MKYEIGLMKRSGAKEAPCILDDEKYFNVLSNKDLDLTVMVTIKDRVLYLTFNSTRTVKNIIEDLVAFPTVKYSGFKFHAGFFVNCISISHLVITELYKVKEMYDSVTIVGHSMGASVGAIFALLNMRLFKITDLKVAGQPAYANWRAIRALQKHVRIESYLNGDDAIRYVTPFMWRNKYKKIGRKHNCLFDAFKTSLDDHRIDDMNGGIGYETALKESGFWR